jgi:hypothetical protein
MDSSRVRELAETLAKKDFAGICDGYAKSWLLIDQELRHICTERCVGHARFDVVYPKVVIIDEAYNAQLARYVLKPDEVGFNAQRAVAEWLSGAGRRQIEEALSVRRATEATTEEWLGACLDAHGRVVKGLSTLGHAVVRPTSFVSKYLHFHNADVVIYDNVVAERLRNLLAQAWGIDAGAQVRCRVLDSAQSSEADPAYLAYLNRFAFLMAAAADVRAGTTVKELDHFLWRRPELQPHQPVRGGAREGSAVR